MSSIIQRPTLIRGISQIIARYDAVFLDAWGVVHDGGALYKGVYACLEELRIANVPVIVISNAARRAYAAVEEITKLGVPESLLFGSITAGEMVWQGLKERTLPKIYLSDRYYYLGPQRSRVLVKDLELDLVSDIGEADVIINTGGSARLDTFADDAPLLQRAARRNLPMICANPDLVAIRNGVAGYSAGSFAAYYESLGATHVLWMGKPDKAIFHKALDLLPREKQQNVLVVGDAIRTDIAGANNANMDSLFIINGIHRPELQKSDDATLDAFISRQAYTPSYMMQRLTW